MPRDHYHHLIIIVVVHYCCYLQLGSYSYRYHPLCTRTFFMLSIVPLFACSLVQLLTVATAFALRYAPMA